METVSKWGFGSESLDMLEILFVVGGERHLEADVFAVNEWEEFFLLENGRIHDVLEISLGQSAVPIIDNVAPVHDLPENVN